MKYSILIHVKATQSTLLMFIIIKMFVLEQFFYGWSQSTVCQQSTEYNATSFVSILNCISSLLIRLHLHWCIFLSPIYKLWCQHRSHMRAVNHKSVRTQSREEIDACSVTDMRLIMRGYQSPRAKLWKKIFLRIIILF